MKNKGKRIIISSVMAVLIIIILIVVTHTNLFLNNTIMLWILAAVYLWAFNYFIVLGWCAKVLRNVESKDIIIVFATSIILSGLLLVIFPYKYGRILTNNFIERMRLTNNEVSISVYTPNDVNGGQEVWVDSLKVDSRAYNIYEIPLDNDIWSFKDGKIYTDGLREHTELEIKFEKGELFEIKFRKTPESGIVLIQTEGYAYILDLYSTNEETIYLDWNELYGSVTSAVAQERIAYYVVYYLILLEISFAIVCFALDRKRKELKQ